MADNTDEEHLVAPPDTQPENPSEEIITSKDTETINPNPETENMEVHHHPDLHHKPKKWKEYFLEFLMIFLAVTLGFFAENLREYFGDKKKEKEYIKSMVADLQADTVELNIAITRWKHVNENTDSLLIYLKTDLSQPTVNKLYNLISNDFFRFDLFKYNNKTLEELKSSGDFRLLKHKDIISEIMSYDVNMKYILTQEQDVKTFEVIFKNAESKIFDFSLLNDKWAYNKSLKYSYEPHNLNLLSYDKQTIAEYFNNLWTFQALAKVHEKLFENNKLIATELLSQIQNKYHLEGE
ncbi:MAG: hypothetical protein V4539_20960 [Bacteroidota bacterium]